MNLPSGRTVERSALAAAVVLLSWIGLRAAEAPFERRALLYDAMTDTLYQVVVTPVLSLDATKRLWLGFDWRSHRTIDRVLARRHLSSAVEAMQAEMAAMEENPERYFDSLEAAFDSEMVALERMWDSVDAASSALQTVDTSTSESGSITFLWDQPERLPPSLELAMQGVDLDENDLVPVAFSMHLHTTEFVYDPPPEGGTITFDVRVVDRGYLIRGQGLRALRSLGVWPFY